MFPRIHRVALIGLLLAFAAPRFVLPQEAPPSPKTPAPASLLSIEAVKVEPSAPAADALCHLAITLKNTGDKTASRFAFQVKVGGVELPAYRNRVYLARLAPGATLELQLLNFWSSESARPAPADGKLTVEVTLAAATWVVAEGGGANATPRTWKPAGAEAAVAGLPLAKSLQLNLAGRTTPPTPKKP